MSVEHDYDVNSLAVPRRAKEAIGAIALLHNEVTIQGCHYTGGRVSGQRRSAGPCGAAGLTAQLCYRTWKSDWQDAAASSGGCDCISCSHGYVRHVTTAMRCRQALGHSMTVNVEYNQLDPLLRATVSPEGDVNDNTGFSPYPGDENERGLFRAALWNPFGLLCLFVMLGNQSATTDELSVGCPSITTHKQGHAWRGELNLVSS